MANPLKSIGGAQQAQPVKQEESILKKYKSYRDCCK